MINFDIPAGAPVVLGIGVFDGVHLGHRKIIAELVKMGRRNGAVPVAVTFFPHPREVLCPASPPRLLLPPDERIRILRQAGAEGIGVIEFSRQMAETAPGDFLEKLLSSEPEIRGICVGKHWRFGRKGDGDSDLLFRWLNKRGLDFKAVPELTIDHKVVSSSAIRQAIADGRLAAAAGMLGRNVRIFGEVEHGFRDAGILLHAPTANLKVDFGVLPPDGVYASLATVEGRTLPALTNIGTSPTFNRGIPRRVETHILDFSGNLYQSKMEVELAEFIRHEKKFPSAAELERQIRADRIQALKILRGAAS